MQGYRLLNRAGATVAAIAGLLFFCSAFVLNSAFADVSHGSKEGAQKYYSSIATTLKFSTPDEIFNTTLDDVTAYLGYKGLTGVDLQNLSSEILMDPDQLLARLGGTKIQPDDILVSRFFAPKIINILTPEADRKFGWRKLVRLRARAGSPAQAHHIAYGIVLFNIFTKPSETPFSAGQESVNTQVILTTELSQVPIGRESDADTIYWLDYGPLSEGGKLVLALNASFDANELARSTGGVQDYFVPDGCVACHGNNPRRSMVNYLDTDHWIDRLDNDFQDLKRLNLPLIFDAQTNDTSTPSYKRAFDVIRRFNAEADMQAKNAQPKHDEVLASQKWHELHASSDEHFAPIKRAIGPAPLWSADDPNDVQTLNKLNQYCFRCHGTVKFSVFNRQAVQEWRVPIKLKIDPNAPAGVRMPTDRDLPADVLEFLRIHLP